MERLKSFFHWLFTSRYQLHLEQELARSREECRHWQNLLLGQLRMPGIPKSSGEELKREVKFPTHKMSHHKMQMKIDQDESAFAMDVLHNESMRTGKSIGELMKEKEAAPNGGV